MERSYLKGITFLRNLIFILIVAFEVLFAARLAFAASYSEPVLIGGSGPADSKAELEVKSTAKYTLLSRMTTTQKNAISSPTEGALLWDNVLHTLAAYDGSQWTAVGAGAGTVVGPGSSTDTALAVFDGTTGALLKNSSLTVSGSTITGSVTGNAGTVTTNANLTGDVTSSGNATTIGAAKVTSAMLAGSIAVNKIAALGTAAIPYTDGSGFLTTTTAPAYDSSGKGITVTGDTSFYKLSSTTDTTATGSFALDHNSTSAILQTAESSTNAGYTLQIKTGNIAGSNANKTGEIQITTGNKTAGTGNSGDVTLTTGTSAGGTRGRINHVDGTDGFAGLVWTSMNNAGGGHWMKPTADINFIANPDAELNTAAWATYADAAGALPVDGTGGSPTVTWTRTTSSPLSGAGSFLLTKDAANRQGNGASYDFSTRTADKARMMCIDADYSVASGTFVAGSNGVDSDIEVYIYDTVNAQIIQPSSYKLFSSSTSPPPHFNAQFQTASNSTSYRLIFHTATTSASAYTVQFDNITVSPCRSVSGTPVTDWVTYTPTFTGFGTVVTQAFRSRRVGANLEVSGQFLTATTTGATAAVSLGYNGVNGNVVADVSVLPVQNIGVATIAAATTTYFGTYILSPATSVNTINFGVQSSTVNGGTAVLGTAFGNAVVIKVEFSTPIVGWSSTVQMSDSAPQSVIAVSLSGTATSVTNSFPVIVPTTIVKDTNGAFSGSTYTVPSPGWYDIYGYMQSASVAFTAGHSISIAYKINSGSTVNLGNTRIPASVTEAFACSGAGLVYVNAGDTIQFAAFSDVTNTPLAFTGAIARRSGPQTIGATESINFKGTNAAGTSIGNGSGFVNIPYVTTWDTHGAWSGTQYKAPIVGKYRVTANVGFPTSVYAVGNITQAGVFVNSSAVSYGLASAAATTTSIFLYSSVSTIVSVNAGDLIEVRVSNNRTAGATLLDTTVGVNHIEIERIGN